MLSRLDVSQQAISDSIPAEITNNLEFEDFSDWGFELSEGESEYKADGGINDVWRRGEMKIQITQNLIDICINPTLGILVAYTA